MALTANLQKTAELLECLYFPVKFSQSTSYFLKVFSWLTSINSGHLEDRISCGKFSYYGEAGLQQALGMPVQATSCEVSGHYVLEETTFERPIIGFEECQGRIWRKYESRKKVNASDSIPKGDKSAVAV